MPREATKPSNLAEKSRRRPDHCEFCGRDKPLTFHHLIPRGDSPGRRGSAAGTRSRGQRSRPVPLRAVPQRDPRPHPRRGRAGRASFNTREQLLAHEGIARHVAWVVKQK